MVKTFERCRAIIAILRGKAIVIEDKGDRCTTFIGSEISNHRLKVLMINSLKAQAS